MLIRLAQPDERGKWDEYVRNHPDATPYHLWAWKESVETAYGHPGYYFFAEESGRICGVLPLIHMKLPLIQNQLVSLPFCDLAGPLAESEGTVQLLLEQAVESGKKIGVRSVEVRSRATQQTILPAAQSDQGTNKVSMLLPLPGSAAELWDGFKSKLRSQIRKAEKNGLTFTLTPNIDDFYAVFSENMRDLGSPVHSRRWIRSILNCYGEKGRMGLVYHEDRPVGAGLILTSGTKVAIPWASTLQKYNRLNPNMLLYWNMLQFAADNGLREFDFGRSTPEEGTFRFKAQWGAVPVPLVWTKISMHTARKNSPKNGESPARKTVVVLWSKLPLAVANFFGPRIRKYISL